MSDTQRAISPSSARLAIWVCITCLLCAAVLTLGCDTVEPAAEDKLVVEGYFSAGQPLPVLTLRSTRPIREPWNPSGTRVTGADVNVRLGTRDIPYTDVPDAPGRYYPAVMEDRARTVPPDTEVAVAVSWNEMTASASDRTPQLILLERAVIELADTPVAAILSDSLGIRFDSLDIDLDVREGFLYLGEVTMQWAASAIPLEPNMWIETQIQAVAPFSSAVVEFFLLTEQIQREADIPSDAEGMLEWRGVYAVPVEAANDPLPPHEVRLALLRSGTTYARFATSRDAPDRREPDSNVDGGLGIIAGIAVDTVRLSIDRNTVLYPPNTP